MDCSSPIIRVSRKRSADPQTALVIEIKRQKNDALLFSLFKSSAAPDIKSEELPYPVIDFRTNKTQEESSIQDANPLAFADNSINEIGGPEPKLLLADEVLTVNGRPLVPILQNPEEIVYDFYKIARGEIEDPCEDYQDWIMRFATKEEAMLVYDGADSSDGGADDDDDSNDESNWRNDYPDEDSEHDPDDTESDREVYGDSYDDGEDEDDRLRQRMQHFSLGALEDSDDDKLDY